MKFWSYSLNQIASPEIMVTFSDKNIHFPTKQSLSFTGITCPLALLYIRHCMFQNFEIFCEYETDVYIFMERWQHSMGSLWHHKALWLLILHFQMNVTKLWNMLWVHNYFKETDIYILFLIIRSDAWQWFADVSWNKDRMVILVKGNVQFIYLR